MRLSSLHLNTAISNSVFNEFHTFLSIFFLILEHSYVKELQQKTESLLKVVMSRADDGAGNQVISSVGISNLMHSKFTSIFCHKGTVPKAVFTMDIEEGPKSKYLPKSINAGL